MLTASAMIGVIGGILLWLIVSHRESMVLEVGRPSVPATSVQVGPSESQSGSDAGRTEMKSAGRSLPAQTVDEALIPQPQIGALPAPLPSDSTFSPEASQAGLSETTTLGHPGAARGSAPVPSPLGKAPPLNSAGGIDDALSFALEAADPYVKEGFTIREDYWGGDLPVKQAKAIPQQLFKGNTYWFWMGTDKAGAKIAVHLYDSDGRLAEAESLQKPHKAAAMVVPKKTGTYYLIVEVEKSPEERSSWALAYGFR